VIETHEAVVALRTMNHHDFVDITDDVKDAVSGSGITHGRVTVFSPNDECPLIANERESGLLGDIRRAVKRLEATQELERPTTIGASSIVFPIVDGVLRLGTWQRLLLFEMGEPGERTVVMQIEGE
jgi:secondary thiamine-phosphate synthase enzyme